MKSSSLPFLLLFAICCVANIKCEEEISDMVRSQCGLPKITQHSINRRKRSTFGENSTAGEFPWMALIKYTENSKESKFVCGGSLITDQHVITTAHCVEHLNEGDKIRLGTLHLEADEEDLNNIQDHEVQNIIKHANFNSATLENDIAVIKLNKAVQITDHVLPICLPSAQEPDPWIKDVLVHAGWGYTEKNLPSNVLQKVEMSVHFLSRCNPSGFDERKLDSRNICASGHYKVPCHGDTGGPLMNKIDGKWYLIGIASWVHPQCEQGFDSGVFIKVSSFRDWILENLS